MFMLCTGKILTLIQFTDKTTFYRICECFFGFPNPTPVPHENATIPCKPNATLSHSLNLLDNGASGKFYNFENEDFPVRSAIL